MKVMFMGDVHGEKDLLESFLNSNCDILFQLGDFGFIWKNNDCKYNKFIRKFAKDFPNKMILFVPGNHENYFAINNCPIVTIYGGKARKISPNIYALERGEIFTIEGKKFLTIGGAYSIDVSYRIPFVSWWPEEQATLKEMTRILKKIENVQDIDYILTHTAPFEIVRKHFYTNENEKFMEFFFDRLLEIFQEQKIKWYCGHWHKSILSNFNKINIRIFNIGEFCEETI